MAYFILSFQESLSFSRDSKDVVSACKQSDVIKEDSRISSVNLDSFIKFIYLVLPDQFAYSMSFSITCSVGLGLLYISGRASLLDISAGIANIVLATKSDEDLGVWRAGIGGISI